MQRWAAKASVAADALTHQCCWVALVPLASWSPASCGRKLTPIEQLRAKLSADESKVPFSQHKVTSVSNLPIRSANSKKLLRTGSPSRQFQKNQHINQSLEDSTFNTNEKVTAFAEPLSSGEHFLNVFHFYVTFSPKTAFKGIIFRCCKDNIKIRRHGNSPTRCQQKSLSSRQLGLGSAHRLLLMATSLCVGYFSIMTAFQPEPSDPPILKSDP